jgi:hypothetical protein
MDTQRSLSRLRQWSSYPRSIIFQRTFLFISKVGAESTKEESHRYLSHDLRIFWVLTSATTIYDFPLIGYPHVFVTSRHPTSVSFALQSPDCPLEAQIYICCGPLQLAYLLTPPLATKTEENMASTEVISKQYVPLTCHGHSRPVTHLSFSGVVNSVEEEYYLISACKGE